MTNQSILEASMPSDVICAPIAFLLCVLTLKHPQEKNSIQDLQDQQNLIDASCFISTAAATQAHAPVNCLRPVSVECLKAIAFCLSCLDDIMPCIL